MIFLGQEQSAFWSIVLTAPGPSALLYMENTNPLRLVAINFRTIKWFAKKGLAFGLWPLMIISVAKKPKAKGQSPAWP